MALLFFSEYCPLEPAAKRQGGRYGYVPSTSITHWKYAADICYQNFSGYLPIITSLEVKEEVHWAQKNLFCKFVICLAFVKVALHSAGTVELWNGLYNPYYIQGNCANDACNGKAQGLLQNCQKPHLRSTVVVRRLPIPVQQHHLLFFHTTELRWSRHQGADQRQHRLGRPLREQILRLPSGLFSR